MSYSGRHFVVIAAISLAFMDAWVIADDASVDAAKERAVADRFADVLERNPRRGTAFDKVYDYHAEQGTVDELCRKYRDRAAGATGPEASASWIIVGLIEFQRGEESKAILAFSQAEERDPENFMASYLLGQTLAATSQPVQGAEAIERALLKMPAAVDLLDAYQLLGRIYQRAQQNKKAREVFQRLEAEFPDDIRVQEQIATTLLDEDALEAALPRFERLVQSSRDPQRRVGFQIEVAEIKSRLGRTADAQADFDKLLSQLNPDDWLFRDIRRRIEAIYLNRDDRAGLIKYYEAWVRQHPEDLDAVARLAGRQVQVGRGREAQEILQRSLDRAPRNKEIRLVLINLLLRNEKYAEAMAQYAELDRHDPGNSDTLRDWGKAILSDESLEPIDRKKKAAVVWRKLLTRHPEDAAVTAQVAELFRQGRMDEDAIALYRRAIELAPDSVQYREYLGEYQMKLQLTDEALATWRELASGTRRTPLNLSRLSELLSRADQISAAIDAIRDACQLDPQDFLLQLKYADLLIRKGRFEEALNQLAEFENLADNDDERELWQERNLRALKETNRIAGRIGEVLRTLESKSSGNQEDAESWVWLAKAHETDGQMSAAVNAIGRAVTLKPESIPVLTVAARVNALNGNLKVAVDLNRRLATLNRRSRLDYFQHIADLEEKLGHPDLALQAGRELLTASPANPEVSVSVAQLCFRLNRPDEGIQILRRTLRKRPDNFVVVARLATALASMQQQNEAIEILWRAFERCESLPDQLQIVTQLTELHLQVDELRKLYSRLEQDRRDPAHHRSRTICLARALEVAGDRATAQQKLELLAGVECHDVDLLVQLRNLADRRHDHQSGIRFQRQLVEITGRPEDQVQLAERLVRDGDLEEAFRLLPDVPSDGKLTPTLLIMVSKLISRDPVEGARRLDLLCQKYPDNWELLYRQGSVLAVTSPDRAVASLQALIKLQLPFDEKSLIPSTTPHEWGDLVAANLPVVDRMEELLQAQEKLHGPIVWWIPETYGLARMAAIVMLAELQTGKQIPSKVMADLLKPPKSRQDFLDQLVLFRRRAETEKQVAVARDLMRQSPDDLEAKVLFVDAVCRRRHGQSLQVRSRSPLQPLETERLQEVLESYHALAGRSELAPYPNVLLTYVVQELVRANRVAHAERLFNDAVASSTTSVELGLLFQIRRRLRESPEAFPSDTNEVAVFCTMLDKLAEITERERTTGTMPRSPRQLGLIALTLPHRIQEDLNPVIQQCRRQETLEVWKHYVRYLVSQAPSAPQAAASAVQQSVPLRSQSAGTQVTGKRLIALTAGPVEKFPGLILSGNAIQILEKIHRQFENDGNRGDEIIAYFKRQSESAPGNVAERLVWRHSLAYLHFVRLDTELAFAVLESAAAENPDRLDLRMGLVQQYLVMKQPASALTVFDSVIASAGSDVNTERMALTLSLAADNSDRAQVAVDRLQDFNLARDELSAVSRQLESGGFAEQAERLLRRAAEMRELQLPELLILMSAQLKLGQWQESTATALRAIELTDRPSFSNRTNRQQTRAQCFAVLEKAGALPPMIEAAERELTQSPTNSATIDYLLELYAAANNSQRMNELELQKLTLEISIPESRCQLALKYVRLEQPENALEQMRFLIQHEPSLFALNVRKVLAAPSPEREALASLLADLDWGQSERHVALMPNIIEQLRSVEASRDIGARIFLKAWENHPEFHVELLHKFNDDYWWGLPEVRQGRTSSLIPRPDQDLKTQWRLFGRSLRYSDKEGLVTVWNRLLTECAADQTLDSFAESVELAIRQRSDWSAGPAILGMIELRRGRIDAGHKLLERFFLSLPEEVSQDPMIVWEIAQELVRREETLDLGARYYSIPIARYGATSASAETLLKAYLKFGRNAEARSMLLGFIPASMSTDADTKLPTKADVSETIAIGKRLRQLDYPLDALELLLTVQPISGELSDDVNSTVAAICRELPPAVFVDHLERLDGKTRPFSMQLYLRASGQSSGQLESRWDLVLDRVAKVPAQLERARTAIRLLSDVQANPLDLHVVAARLSLSAGEDPRAVAENLIKYLDAHPLQVRLANPNSVTPTAESSQATVWLVARVCLEQPASCELGAKLGKTVLDFTQRDRAAATTISILSEWTRISLQLGKIETVEQLLQSYDSIECKLAILSEWLEFAIRSDDSDTIERVKRRIGAIQNGNP